LLNATTNRSRHPSGIQFENYAGNMAGLPPWFNGLSDLDNYDPNR